MIHELLVNGVAVRIRVTQQPGGASTCEFAEEKSAWQPLEVGISPLSPGSISLLLPDGSSLTAWLDTSPQGDAIILFGHRYAVSRHDPRSISESRGAADTHKPATLTSPMPGRILRILKPAGSQVQAKDGVLVIEAMKMQNELKSPKAGTVKTILVTEGDSVTSGQPVAVIE